MNLKSLQEELVTGREHIDREAGAGERFRLAAQDCFDRMEKQFASVDQACNRNALDLRTLAESSAEMGTGFNQLKTGMSKLASNTANELQAMNDEWDQVCDSLCKVSKSWASSTWARRPVRSVIDSESRTMEIRSGA